MFEKIEGLDMIQHNHSLIVIKDSFSGIKERYLLYYDEKWDCKLFLNYKTQDRNNEDVIVDNVSADSVCSVSCLFILVMLCFIGYCFPVESGIDKYTVLFSNFKLLNLSAVTLDCLSISM